MHMRVKFKGQIVPFVTAPYEVHLPGHTLYARLYVYTSVFPYSTLTYLMPTCRYEVLTCLVYLSTLKFGSVHSFQTERQGTRDIRGTAEIDA